MIGDDLIESISLTQRMWLTRSYHWPHAVTLHSTAHRPMTVLCSTSQGAGWVIGAIRQACLSARRPLSAGGRRVPITRAEVVRYLRSAGAVLP